MFKIEKANGVYVVKSCKGVFVCSVCPKSKLLKPSLSVTTETLNAALDFLKEKKGISIPVKIQTMHDVAYITNDVLSFPLFLFDEKTCFNYETFQSC